MRRNTNPVGWERLGRRVRYGDIDVDEGVEGDEGDDGDVYRQPWWWNM